MTYLNDVENVGFYYFQNLKQHHVKKKGLT